MYTMTRTISTVAAEASESTPVVFPEVVCETRTIEGIKVPWQRVERSGPLTKADGSVHFEDRAPKGTVLESGEVFIPLSQLEELSEQGQWDSQFGEAFLLGAYEGYALEALGYAEQETRGGYHGTEALAAFLAQAYGS